MIKTASDSKQPKTGNGSSISQAQLEQAIHSALSLSDPAEVETGMHNLLYQLTYTLISGDDSWNRSELVSNQIRYLVSEHHEHFQSIDWQPYTHLFLRAFDGGLSLKKTSFRAAIKTLVDTFPSFDINNVVFEGGVTLLMRAVSDGRLGLDEIRAVLDAGADVNALSNKNGRPIHFICKNDMIAVHRFKLLIAYGANPGEQINYLSGPIGDIGSNSGRFRRFDSLEEYLLDDLGTGKYSEKLVQDCNEIIQLIKASQRSLVAESEVDPQWVTAGQQRRKRVGI